MRMMRFFFFLSSKEERNSIVAVKCLRSFFKIYAIRNVHLCLNVTKVQEGALRQCHLSMCINIQKLLRKIQKSYSIIHNVCLPIYVPVKRGSFLGERRQRKKLSYTIKYGICTQLYCKIYGSVYMLIKRRWSAAVIFLYYIQNSLSHTCRKQVEGTK